MIQGNRIGDDVVEWVDSDLASDAAGGEEGGGGVEFYDAESVGCCSGGGGGGDCGGEFEVPFASGYG